MLPDFENSAFSQMINMQKELFAGITRNTSFHDQIARACQAVGESNRGVIESMQPLFDSSSTV